MTTKPCEVVDTQSIALPHWIPRCSLKKGHKGWHKYSYITDERKEIISWKPNEDDITYKKYKEIYL